MPNQHTIERSASLSGTGLHSGLAARVALRPAPAGTGIVFENDDAPSLPPIPARVDRVVDTRLATTLGNEAWRVATVEHLLAALLAQGIDNASVGVAGGEIPALDGSARPWFELIRESGRREQAASRRFLRVLSPLEIVQGERRARILPHEGLALRARVRFDHTLVGEQVMETPLDDGEFGRGIAWARTFGFLHEVEAMARAGLARGGSLQNAVVYGPEGVLNPEGLRAPDEPVRHKLLDMLGDLALLGRPLVGRFEADLPGHALNVATVAELLRRTECWEVAEQVELDPALRGS